MEKFDMLIHINNIAQSRCVIQRTFFLGRLLSQGRQGIPDPLQHAVQVRQMVQLTYIERIMSAILRFRREIHKRGIHKTATPSRWHELLKRCACAEKASR